MATAADALSARVADAVTALPRPAQVALQLCEQDGADHAAIAVALRMDEASVPELLLSARLGVYEALRRGPAPVATSRACGSARRGLVQLQDHEPAEGVREHVERCESCQALRRALREASVAYRAWDGSVPPPAARKPAAPPPTTRRRPGPTLVARHPAEPAPKVRYPAPLPTKAPKPPREVILRRRLAALGALILTILAVVLVVSLIRDSGDGQPVRVNNGSDVIPPPGETFCAVDDPDCQ